METSQRPMTPRSMRTPTKVSNTLSRFKGIIRIRRGPEQDKGNAKDVTNSPYSRSSITVKAFMSQPALSSLRNRPMDADDSTMSASIDRDSDSVYDYPRPSIHSEDHAKGQSLGQAGKPTRSMANAGMRTTTLPQPPSTPPPKSPSLFRRRRSSSTAQEALPLTSSPAQSNGLRSFTRGLVRRASRSRIIVRPEDEPPVPPLPSPFRHHRAPLQLEPSASASTSSSTASTTTRDAPNNNPSHACGHALEVDRRLDDSVRLSNPAPLNAKASVASFVSSSECSYRTALSTQSERPRTPEELTQTPTASTSELRTTSSNTVTDDQPECGLEGANGRGRTGPQRLSTPAKRFSLISSEGAARLSPSLVLRPPPLPILNLPKLSTSTPVTSSGPSRRTLRGNAGLRAMPALPLQGNGRGVGGHEEHDDEEAEEHVDESDGDEDEDEDERLDAPRPSTSTSSTSGSDRARNSYEHGSSPSRGSNSVSGVPTFNPPIRRPQLPPLQVASPFAIRFPAGAFGTSDSNPATAIPPSAIAKGKNREIETPTPIDDRGLSSTSNSRGFGGGEIASSSGSSASGSNYFGSDDFGRPSSLLASSTSVGRVQIPPSPRAPVAGFTAEASGLGPALVESPLRAPRLNERHFSRNPFRAGTTPPSGLEPSNSLYGKRLSAIGLGGQSLKRPSMYKHASRSLIDVHTIEKREEVERMVREGEEEQERASRRKSARIRQSLSMALTSNTCIPPPLASPCLDPRAQGPCYAAARASMIETAPNAESDEMHNPKQASDRRALVADQTRHTPATTAGLSDGGPRGGLTTLLEGVSDNVDQGLGQERGQLEGKLDLEDATMATTLPNRMSVAPAYDDANPHPLRKRRSMPMFNEFSTPPPYPIFVRDLSGRFAHIEPREDEGREELPPYTNSIYLKAILPRKMEFTSPGVQAKDRKWRRVLVILDGTMLKVYKCPLGAGGVSAIEHWWENKVGAGDVAIQTELQNATLRPRKTSAESVKNAVDEKIRQQYPSSTAMAVTTETNPHATVASTTLPPSSMRFKERGVQSTFSRSAINLATHLLKPHQSRHIRSHSDIPPASPNAISSRPSTSHSSLNLAHRSGTPTPNGSVMASRSHSPIPPASATAPYNSSSDTVTPITPTQAASLMVPPAANSSPPTRSATPSRGGRSRAGTNPWTPRSASSSSDTQTLRDELNDGDQIPDPSPEDLIRVYTLQNAESGLGNDYAKRKNVLRVRIEGEQFLLQAKDVGSVVEWIEGLQAATNVALDLDSRPMPRGPIFPRRRRRRRPQVPLAITTGAPATVTTQSGAANMVTETYTPTSATAGQPALRRIQQ